MNRFNIYIYINLNITKIEISKQQSPTKWLHIPDFTPHGCHLHYAEATQAVSVFNLSSVFAAINKKQQMTKRQHFTRSNVVENI